jgi:hypothetical protein
MADVHSSTRQENIEIPETLGIDNAVEEITTYRERWRNHVDTLGEDKQLQRTCNHRCTGRV